MKDRAWLRRAFGESAALLITVPHTEFGMTSLGCHPERSSGEVKDRAWLRRDFGESTALLITVPHTEFGMTSLGVVILNVAVAK